MASRPMAGSGIAFMVLLGAGLGVSAANLSPDT
jgi:hypothetical protein